MIFTSPHAKLSIVITPARHTFDSVGGRMFVAGKKVKFADGRFRTEDKEVIEFLLNHKDLGIRFHAEGVKTEKSKVIEAKKKEEALAEETKAEKTDKKVSKK